MTFAKAVRIVFLTCVCLLALTRPAAAQGAAPIKDNSFLIEEAFNQEKGVVQHISTFNRPTSGSGSGWAFAFTQEWPVRGMRHQFSYTVPVTDAGSTGLGDIVLNYRYQLKGVDGGRVAVAPRLSLIVPSGDAAKGMGAGGPGVQTNLPVSIELDPRVTLHANAGFTHTPSAKDASGNTAATTAFGVGGSLIWLTSATFNVMLETTWASAEFVSGSRVTARTESFVIAPGVRSAFNLSSGMQIVPGLAYVFGVGPSRRSNSLFLYFSVEHSFGR